MHNKEQKLLNIMQLHELRSTVKRNYKKVVGRGGKRGTTAGKGTKGQHARSGHRIRPAERDMLLRFPKLKGVKHKPLQPKPFLCDVGDLERMFPSVSELTKKLFIERGYSNKKNTRVKILGDGTLQRAFVIKGIECSKSAKTKIEAAGGKVI